MKHMKGRWPNLFIVGAPRSGTTTLHSWLGQHPDIFMSRIKEPHYFSDIDFPGIGKKVLQVTRQQSEYLDLFSEAEETIIRGESSSHYLADPCSPKHIYDAVPNAKIIAILRDPVQRAYSHYLLYGRRGEQRTFLDIVQDCLEQNPPYDNLTYNLVDMGYYHTQLERYYRYFPVENILVLSFYELQYTPTEVLRRVCSFLGVDNHVIADINTSQVNNQYMQPSNALFRKLSSSDILTALGLKLLPRSLLSRIRYKLLLKPAEKPELDQESRRLLTLVYEPEVERLERLLGENFNSLRESFSKRQ